MRAYYYDNIEGDQRLPHDSGKDVSQETLSSIGVSYFHIPIDAEGAWEKAIDEVAQTRGYKNRDVINVSKEGLGDAYEAKIKSFFEEYVITDRRDIHILGTCTKMKRLDSFWIVLDSLTSVNTRLMLGFVYI